MVIETILVYAFSIVFLLVQNHLLSSSEKNQGCSMLKFLFGNLLQPPVDAGGSLVPMV